MRTLERSESNDVAGTTGFTAGLDQRFAILAGHQLRHFFGTFVREPGGAGQYRETRVCGGSTPHLKTANRGIDGEFGVRGACKSHFANNLPVERRGDVLCFAGQGRNPFTTDQEGMRRHR